MFCPIVFPEGNSRRAEQKQAQFLPRNDGMDVFGGGQIKKKEVIKMKIIINENERAFLFKNGVYRKMLTPGKRRIKSWLGEKYVKVNVAKPVEIANMDVTVLLRDESFAQSVARIDVPNTFEIAVLIKDDDT